MRSILRTTARQGHGRYVVSGCKYMSIHDVPELICLKSTQGSSAGMMSWTNIWKNDDRYMVTQRSSRGSSMVTQRSSMDHQRSSMVTKGHHHTLNVIS